MSEINQRLEELQKDASLIAFFREAQHASELMMFAEAVLDHFRANLAVDPHLDTSSIDVVADAVVVNRDHDYRIPAIVADFFGEDE